MVSFSIASGLRVWPGCLLPAGTEGPTLTPRQPQLQTPCAPRFGYPEASNQRVSGDVGSAPCWEGAPLPAHSPLTLAGAFELIQVALQWPLRSSPRPTLHWDPTLLATPLSRPESAKGGGGGQSEDGSSDLRQGRTGEEVAQSVPLSAGLLVWGHMRACVCVCVFICVYPWVHAPGSV